MNKQISLLLACFFCGLTLFHTSAHQHINTSNIKKNTIVQNVTCDSSSMTVTIRADPHSFIYLVTGKIKLVTQCSIELCTFTVSNLTHIDSIIGPGNVTVEYFVKLQFVEEAIHGRVYFDANCVWAYTYKPPNKNSKTLVADPSNVFLVEVDNYLNYTIIDTTTGADPPKRVKVGDDVTLSVFAMGNGAAVQDFVPYECYWTNSPIPRMPALPDQFVRLNNTCPYQTDKPHLIKFKASKLDDSGKAYVCMRYGFLLVFQQRRMQSYLQSKSNER